MENITIDNQQISSFLKGLSTHQLLYVNGVISHELSNRRASIIAPPKDRERERFGHKSMLPAWSGYLPPEVLRPKERDSALSPTKDICKIPSPYRVCGNTECKCQYFPRVMDGKYETNTPSLFHTKLFIHGMDQRQTQTEATSCLRDIIGGEVNVTEIKYKESNTFAFVTLASHEEAVRAQEILIHEGFNVNFARIHT